MTVSTEGAEKASLEKPKNEETKAKVNARLMQLSLGALGVVFGDIATSPIYAIRECFNGEYGIAVSPVNVMGILSLMFWALVMIVGMKYLLFVFRADNRGEGGVITGILAAIESPAYLCKSDRPDLCGPGQLDAHGLHDCPGGRFSNLQQTCSRFRGGFRLKYACADFSASIFQKVAFYYSE